MKFSLKGPSPLGVKSPLHVLNNCAEERSPECTKCALHEVSKVVGAFADGKPGGLLVLGGSPSSYDNADHKPFSSAEGRFIRKTLSTAWSWPIAYDYAIRCAPAKKPTPAARTKYVNACRPYTADIINKANPKFILVTDNAAMESLTGRTSLSYIRRGFMFLDVGGRKIPTFFFPNMGMARSNSFRRKYLLEDLQWALTTTHVEPSVPDEATLVQTIEEAEEAFQTLKANKCLFLDIEAYGSMYGGDYVALCVSVVPLDGSSAYVWDTRDLSSPLIPYLVNLIEDESIAKGGTNFKYDVEGIEHYLSCRVGGKLLDTRLVHKLYNDTEDADLESCADQVGFGPHKADASFYVDKAAKQISGMRSKVKKALGDESTYEQRLAFALDSLGASKMLAHAVASTEQKPRAFAFAFVPDETLFKYNALDSISSAHVWGRCWALLRKEPGLKMVWDEILQPAIRTFCDLEARGMPVVRENLEDFAEFLDGSMTEVKLQMLPYVTTFNGGVINIDSAKQVSEFLFKHLKLPIFKHGKEGPSSDIESLKAIEDKHPFVPLLIEYRKFAKMQSNYGRKMMSKVTPDGRVHCTFNLVGAASGRLTCSNPSLHTIPSRGDLAKKAKAVFGYKSGRKIIQADYSQIEIRVAAMLCGDPEMKKVFQEGLDVHSSTAAIIAPAVWGFEFVAPTAELQAKDPVMFKQMEDVRRSAKPVIFGILYGMADEALAKKASVNLVEASDVRQALVGKYKRLVPWCQEQTKFAKANGYSITLWKGKPARRRFLVDIGEDPDARGRRGELYGTAERSSFNSPVQGTASDYCLASIVAIDKWLKENGLDAYVVLTVHDSILVDAADDIVDYVAANVKRIMESQDCGDVPLKADISVGPTWGDLKVWSEAC